MSFGVSCFSFAVLCGMLMTACDVSAIAKPWEQQHLLAKRVADEFFDQGDLEKLRLNTQPIVSSSFRKHFISSFFLLHKISKNHIFSKITFYSKLHFFFQNYQFFQIRKVVK